MCKLFLHNQRLPQTGYLFLSRTCTLALSHHRIEGRTCGRKLREAKGITPGMWKKKKKKGQLSSRVVIALPPSIQQCTGFDDPVI